MPTLFLSQRAAPDFAPPGGSAVRPAGVAEYGSESAALRFDRVLCFALFTGTLIVYLRTLCPTIFADDCGEIATAVATGGVMHPPGYPLYTLLGGWLIRCIPFGEPAWRLGLLSAVAASGCAPMVYCLARRVGANCGWAAASALAFAFSLCLWQQATKVETYALNACLVALVFTLGSRACESGRMGDLALAAAGCGLALTNHLTSSCAVLGAGWLIVAAARGQKRPVGAVAVAVACAVAPLGLYSLLWAHAAAHPGGQVWGEPDSWRRLLLHVSGARYRVYVQRESVGAVIRRDFVSVPALLWRNIGPLLIGIVPGCARALRSQRPRTPPLAIAMLIALGAYAVQTSLYGILNIFEYYTVPLMLICVFCGAGCEEIVAGIARRISSARPLFEAGRWRVLAALVSCAGVLVIAPMAHWEACDRSRATFMRDLALNTLRTMPRDAVLITVGDNRVFPLWYAQDVLGVRRDVAVIPRTAFEDLHTAAGRGEMGWLTRKLAAENPGLVDAPEILAKSGASAGYVASQQAVWEIGIRALETGRPLLVTDLLPSDLDTGGHSVALLREIRPDMGVAAAGLADEIVPLRQYPSLGQIARTNTAMEARMTIEPAPDALMAGEPDGNFTNHVYAAMLERTGELMLQTGDVSGAQAQLQAAAGLRPDVAAPSDDFGAGCQFVASARKPGLAREGVVR